MTPEEKIEFAIVNQLEIDKVKAFREKVKAEYGKYGQFQHIFTPCGIGCKVEIKSELSGETVDVTNYAIW